MTEPAGGGPRPAAGPPLSLLIAGAVTAALVAFSAWTFRQRARSESA